MDDARDVRRFLDKDFADFPGWFSITDAELFRVVDEVQNRAGVVGDLFEIGVFKGKSAVLLGFFARPSEEQLYVCDLFEIPDPTEDGASWREFFGAAKPTEAEFLRNYARFHHTSPHVLAMPSSELDSQTLGEGAFRLLHIDGAHDLDSVRSDLALSRRLAGPGAVVIFDDTVHRLYPGVAAAVWDAVAHDGLVPILLTNKLYATWDADSEIAELVRERVLESDRFTAFEHTIAGSTIALVSDLAKIKRAVTSGAPPESQLKQWARELTPPIVYRGAFQVKAAIAGRRERRS